MGKSLNSYNASGGVGRDPEVRYVGDSPVAKFSLAIENLRKGGESDTLWMDVEAWGKLAENVGLYVKKGSKVAVSGSLKQEKWVDKGTGQERTKILIKASEVIFLSGQNGQNHQAQNYQAQGHSSPNGGYGNEEPLF
jgi:single-strand DNA-binding protein